MRKEEKIKALRNFIKTTIREYLNENIASSDPSEYAGHHSAPDKSENDAMCDVSNMFPDMYTENAFRYYGVYGLDDNSVINQIKSAHNKPNKPIIIYRAVPYLNKDIDKKIKSLVSIINYKNKYGFLPVGNEIIEKLEVEVKSKIPSLTYDEMKKQVEGEIYNLIDELDSQRQKPIKINNGDWVTTSKLYAKQHGVSHLNNEYKIVKKTVKASQLYTEGNSIFEWGYNV